MCQIRLWLLFTVLVCFLHAIHCKELRHASSNVLQNAEQSSKEGVSLASVLEMSKSTLLDEAEKALQEERELIKQKASDYRYKLLGIKPRSMTMSATEKSSAQLLETGAAVRTSKELGERYVRTETGELQKVRFGHNVFNRKKMNEIAPNVVLLDTSSTIEASRDGNERLRRAIEIAEHENRMKAHNSNHLDVRNYEIEDFFDLSEQEVQSFIQQQEAKAEIEAERLRQEKLRKERQKQKARNEKKKKAINSNKNKKKLQTTNSLLQVNDQQLSTLNTNPMASNWPFETIAVPSMAYSPPSLTDGPQDANSYSITKPADQMINHLELSPRENTHHVNYPIFPSTNPVPLAPNEKAMPPPTMYMQGTIDQYNQGAVPTAGNIHPAYPSLALPDSIQNHNVQLNQAAVHDAQFYADTPFYPTQANTPQFPPAAIEQPFRGDASSPYGSNIPVLPFQQFPAAPNFQ